MIQTTRTRLGAPGFVPSAGRELPALEPWTDLTRDMERLASAALRPDGGSTAASWMPAVDVEEREDAVRLAFEVPGVAPDALEVTVHDRLLTVAGERRLERRDDGQSAYRLERRYGRFSRTLALPKTVDPDRIEARHAHGVLYLDLPKRPEAQPRRIAVNVGREAPAERAPAEQTPADRRRVESGAAEG
jgi:HSP20 family protein